jgi:hypothetical protein
MRSLSDNGVTSFTFSTIRVGTVTDYGKMCNFVEVMFLLESKTAICLPSKNIGWFSV